MLLDIDFVILDLLLGEQSLLIEFLSLNRVALVFDLRSQLSTNELFFLRGNLLGQLEGLEPILEVHSHFKG